MENWPALATGTRYTRVHLVLRLELIILEEPLQALWCSRKLQRLQLLPPTGVEPYLTLAEGEEPVAEAIGQ